MASHYFYLGCFRQTKFYDPDEFDIIPISMMRGYLDFDDLDLMRGPMRKGILT